MLVVFAADEDKGVARRRHLFHDHDCWNRFLEGFDFPGQAGIFPAYFSLFLGSEILPITFPQFGPLCRGRGGHPHDLPDLFRDREDLGLVGPQYSRVDAQLVDQSVEARFAAAAGADPQWRIVLEGLIQLVEQHFRLNRFAAGIDHDASRFAGAIVGHDYVIPAVDFQGLLAFNSKRVVEPALGQMDLQFALHQVDAVAVGLGLFRHAREDGAVLLAREDPEREGERIEEAEIANVAGIGKTRAVQVDGLTHPARLVRRRPVMESNLLVVCAVEFQMQDLLDSSAQSK